MMMLGPVFMILVIALCVAAAVLLIRWIGGGPSFALAPNAPGAHTGLDILKDRFARGEIDKTEFEERHRILANSR